MKRIAILFLLCGSISFLYSANPEVVDRLQELKRGTDTIISKVTSIQLDDEDISGIDQLSEQLSAVENILCSKIENISVNVELSSVDVEVSGIEELEEQISINDALILTAIDDQTVTLCSKLDDLEVTVSGLDELEAFISTNDEITISVFEDLISESDAMLCTKIGTLDAEGTCLESVITVPDDINNLNENVIALLKTILLELRGCSS